MPTPKLKAEYDRLYPRDGVYDPTIHAFDYPEAPNLAHEPTIINAWFWSIAAVAAMTVIPIVVVLGWSA